MQEEAINHNTSDTFYHSSYTGDTPAQKHSLIIFISILPTGNSVLMCKAILLVSYPSYSYGLLLGNEDASLGFHSFNDRK